MEAHRAGPYKQKNKAHKTSGKKKHSSRKHDDKYYDDKYYNISSGSSTASSSRSGSKKGSKHRRKIMRKCKALQVKYRTQYGPSKKSKPSKEYRYSGAAPILIAVLELGKQQQSLLKSLSEHQPSGGGGGCGAGTNPANHSLFTSPVFLLSRIQFDSRARCAPSKRGQYLHLELPKLHSQFQIVSLNRLDLYGALDIAKIADVLLLLHPLDIEEMLGDDPAAGLVDSEAHQILEAIFHHCLPQTLHAIVGLSNISKSKQRDNIRKLNLELIQKNYPATYDGREVKLRSLDHGSELSKLFYLCSKAKRRPNTYCSRRSQLLAETIAFEGSGGEEEANTTGSLVVEGYVRTSSFNVNSLVYIPEFGEFQLDLVESAKKTWLTKYRGPEVINYREQAVPELRPSLLERENPVQTLYEQEMDDLEPVDVNDNDVDLESQSVDKSVKVVGGQKTKVEKKKVPKGTSDYQAAWIVDSDDDKDEEEEGESDENEDDFYDNQMATDKSDKKHVSFAPVQSEKDQFDDDDDIVEQMNGELEDEDDDSAAAANGGDVDVDDDDTMAVDNETEDQAMLAKFKEQRLYEMFPDEVDTPLEQSARERFGKYRGLKSFRTSTWDTKENLPSDYSRIFQFENFNRTRRRLFKTDSIGAEPGYYVRVRVANVPRTLYDYYVTKQPDKPLILFQLLAHEHKMSVMNLVLRKVATCEQPIKNKEELIFHVGCRRFVARPIFSAHDVGDKHKYEKYLRSDMACVATIYAPITFPPASVLVYKCTPSGEHQLVATGSLLDCSPDRLVIKRYILSGHPFKINRKHAVVRYMFFNREDILWFKPVELRTKYGRRGHILEPLGTHGHMKCIFDRQLNSQDTVLMCLYKRVFPKWNYRDRLVGEQAVKLLPKANAVHAPEVDDKAEDEDEDDEMMADDGDEQQQAPGEKEEKEEDEEEAMMD